jgi:DNA-binding beta-propeller fold protein YncE
MMRKPPALLVTFLLAPLACGDATTDDDAVDDAADEIDDSESGTSTDDAAAETSSETGSSESGSSESDTSDSESSETESSESDTSESDSTESSESDTSESDSTESSESDASDSDSTDTTGDGDIDVVLTAIEPLGTYATGAFDEGAAEIVDHHVGTQRLFVVNGADETLDVLDLADPSNLTLVDQLAITQWGASPNSVAIHGDLIAVAIEALEPIDPGVLLLLDATTLAYVNHLTVGVLPDMVTFTPDGSHVLVACEGQPAADYLIDPAGTVAIVDVSGDVASLADGDVQLADFANFSLANLDPQVRIFGPGSSVAQDLEPEYIALSADSTTAWVTLQENNAFAVLDVASASVIDIVALGFKNHSQAGKGLDPSDLDAAIAITDWPVFGMYQPDAVASFELDGQTFLITANEGDARDYEGFGEETRVADLTLDPMVFPNAEELQSDGQLGRLGVSRALGDIDNDGEYERLYTFGARSIAVWSSTGTLIWDSGEQLEQQVAAALPEVFNSNSTANGSFDGRSDNKGPEPEGVTVATLWGKPYAFVGLERIGGIMVFDLSDPQVPAFVLYDSSTRDFDGIPEDGTAGDLGPEGLRVIAAADSPTGEPLLVVANEVSGTVTVYRIVGESPA